MLDRLAELVFKPVDGYGGTGIVIGPHATRAELAQVGAAICADPAAWVAQDLVQLSTHPVGFVRGSVTGDFGEPLPTDELNSWDT